MRKDLRIVMVGLGAWVMCTACNGCLGLKPPTEQPGSTLPKTCDEEQPAFAPSPLDILFVIDNSSSMKEEQEAVASEMTAFVSELRTSGGVEQDLRVGVITTTVYQHTNVNGFDFFADCNTRQTYCTQSGKLQPVPDRGSDGGILYGSGSERVINSSDPEFIDKFARLVQQGTTGSGQETPFEALRLALFDWQQTPLANGGNGGFLRDGARLLIVTLTDEDDCSEKFTRPSVVSVGDQPDVDYCTNQSAMLTPVQEYYDLFAGLKNSDGSRKDIVYTVIGPVSNVEGGSKRAMGILEDTIGPDGGVAMRLDGGIIRQVRNIECPTSIQPGYRHRQMAELFYADLANLDSICKPSYRQTLIDIANLAGVSQTLQLSGVPDPGVLQITLVRADGSLKSCTVDNGGLTFDERTAENPNWTIHFEAGCKRRRDDREMKIDKLCIY